VRGIQNASQQLQARLDPANPREFITLVNSKPALFVMKSLIAAFTALNVLAHSVFGCCSHHAGSHPSGAAVERDCESPAEVGYSISEHDHDGECHTHFMASSPTAVEQPRAAGFCGCHSSGHGSHQCPHATCQWLARDVAATTAVFDLINHVATNTTAPLMLVPGTTDLRSREIALVANSTVPLRLHLALGVLLI
jgi:hypothetical protein